MSWSRIITSQCFVLSTGLVLTCASPAWAAKKFEDEYAQAVAAYQKRDYAGAGDLFWKSIIDGNGSASAWLYCAHCKAGQGKLSEARDAYVQVTSIYKGSEEAKAAAGCIQGLDSKTWHPGPAAGAANAAAAQPTVKAAAVTAAPIAASGFRNRIEIIAPRDSHPKVSSQTISIITQAIDRLPKPIYKILDENGAKVNIGPNIIDKWPDSLTMPKPGSTEVTLAEEGGRTYGRDIHIYERSIVTQGSRELGPVRPKMEIEANFLHEIGHALDDCLGLYSRDRTLQGQYKMDSDGLNDSARVGMENFLQPGDVGPAEACAESVMVLLGGSHKETERFNRNFPRTEAWVKAKLKL